jgi:lysozyme family protein
MSPDFIRAFSFVVSPSIEGGLSLDPDDRGNWTGGKKGEGELLGTKYGISAMKYPQLDIRSLTVDQAREIYHRDYWIANQCQLLPARLALAHLDFCVNAGPANAVPCLQRAVGAKDDGVVGPITLAKARSMDLSESLPNYLAERSMFYAGLKQFPKYGRGWMERVVRLAMELGR